MGLKVLYRMVVRGRIDPHRPAALHLTVLFLPPSFLSLAFLFFFLLLASPLLTHLTMFFVSILAHRAPLSSSLLSSCYCVARRTDFRWDVISVSQRQTAKARVMRFACKQSRAQSGAQSGTGAEDGGAAGQARETEHHMMRGAVM